jgi:hypothetical protein
MKRAQTPSICHDWLIASRLISVLLLGAGCGREDPPWSPVWTVPAAGRGRPGSPTAGRDAPPAGDEIDAGVDPIASAIER